MKGKVRVAFSGRTWRHPAQGGWCFVAMPVEVSAEIRAHTGWAEEGWGRLKATVRVGQSTWGTSVWFDTQRKTYLVPIKAEIRRKEGIAWDAPVEIEVWV